MALLWTLSALAASLPPETTDARAIMEAVESRDRGDRATSRMSITITDKAGRERNRVVVARAMDHEGAMRQLLLFESPPDVRNAGMLSWDWDDAAKADDQWLYLPSVGKPTRIAGSDRSSSFMGTDLTFADMTRKNPDRYTYTIEAQEEVVDGKPCWVVSAVPDAAEQAETGYLKSHLWVSKADLVPLQVKAWVIAGKKMKYTKFEDYRVVSGLPVAHKITVRTIRNGELESQSTLVMTDVAFDQTTVSPADFEERRLERGL